MAYKVGLILGMSIVASPALAQRDDSAVSNNDIVVTAQKREQSLISVPVAVSVVTADQLAKTGGSSFSDITRIAPGVTITEGGEANNSVIQVRGIGTFAFSVGVEPSVLVVIDDVALGQQAQALGDLVDIERIEVLRGPQSALFGKAASAGVISVTTKAPSNKLTYYGELRLTEDNEQRYAMSISGPLTDTLSLRVSGALSRFSGTGRNLFDGKKINGRHNDNFRASMRWAPSDVIDVTLNGHLIQSWDDCCSLTFRELNSSSQLLGIPGAAFSMGTLASGIRPGPGNRDVRMDAPSFTRTKDRGGSLRVNAELPSFTVSSITALNKYSLFTVFDLDNTAADIAGAFTGGASHGGVAQNGSFDTRLVSQELRLTSQPGALEWLLGGYFADVDSKRSFARPLLSPTDFYGNVKSQSYALFGQAEWKFAPPFSIIANARLNHENLSYRYSNNLIAQQFSDDASSTAVTGKVGLQYQPSSDLMIFSTYSRGFKGKQFDLTSNFSAAVAARQPINPEKSDNFEAGIKARLLDRRLNINLALFSTKFRDFQAQTIPAVIGAGVELANVGSVRTRGVEIEALATPVKDLRLGSNIAYTDAKILSFPRAQCFPLQTVAQGCSAGVQNLAGSRLPNAPEWKITSSLDYALRLPDAPFDLSLNLNYAWQSAVQFSISQDPLTTQSSYGVMNGSVGLTTKGSNQFKLTAFARNIFNKEYATNMSNLTLLYGGQTTLLQALPRDIRRVIGLTASISY